MFELEATQRERFGDLVRALEASAEAFRRLAVSGGPEPLSRAFRELARVRRAQVEELRPWAGVHASPSSGGVHRTFRMAWPSLASALKLGLVAQLLAGLERLEGALEALHRDLVLATTTTPLHEVLARHLEQSRAARQGLLGFATPEAEAA